MQRKSGLAAGIAKMAVGFALMGTLLFGCAGSLAYWNGWLFLGVLGALMLAMGLTLLLREPDTLARRLKTRERESAQRGYMALFALIFLATFVLAGLSWRYGWSQVPVWGVAVALGAMVAGYAIYAAVMMQNAYASRVVEVETGQKIITTGLYGVVRHPLYLGSLLLFMSMPFVLGSAVAFLPMLAYPAVIVMRIQNEEEVLARELEGYPEYMKQTKYRLVPFIW